MSGPDRVRRFISSRAPTGATPKFLHGRNDHEYNVSISFYCVN